MGKNKLKHFAEMLSFPNVLQYDKTFRGKWNEAFGNDHPITLELACGKGEYTVGLAQLFPERNHIGIDIKGARIYTGAKRALELGLNNVRFLRTQIDHLPEFFAESEVDEIWITFPDPHLRVSRARQRLTSPKFIDIYRTVLRAGGTVNLKTDSLSLYDYTLEVIDELKLLLQEKMDDVYANPDRDPRLNIRTYYEGLHLTQGKTIKYVRFALGG
jgi:tRNA (guanine-N7-)-methyltransferase